MYYGGVVCMRWATSGDDKVKGLASAEQRV